MKLLNVSIGALLLAGLANGAAGQLQIGDCEAASNWAGAEPTWYVDQCGAPALSENLPQRGVAGATSDAWMLNFGIFSDPADTGVLTYPMPDILTATQLDPDAATLFSADFNQSTEQLIAIRNDDFTLGTIDTTSGAYSVIGTITGPDDTQTLTGLAWDPTDGTWYLSVGATLFTIDPATAVATEIGSTGLVDETLIDIKFDSTGQLYGTTIGDDSLYAIDKTDASSTLIGALGVDINFAQGMAYDYSTDEMWAWLYQGGGNVTWGTIDLATGAVAVEETFAGDGPEASGAILGGFGGGGAMPEPQAVPTLGVAGLGIIALVLVGLGLVAVGRSRV